MFFLRQLGHHCTHFQLLGLVIQLFMNLTQKMQTGPLKGKPLQWRHNERESVSNHQTHDCLLNRLFRRRSKKTSKLRVTDLCAGNSPGTGEFPAQMASYAENVSIWWRHHVISNYHLKHFFLIRFLKGKLCVERILCFNICNKMSKCSSIWYINLGPL